MWKMLTGSTHSNGSPSDDHRRRQLITVSSPPPLSIHEPASAENVLDVHDFSLTTADKRKREGKRRSRVWQHFTKLIKEDGSCEKCKCNHCLRLFTCSSRSGTTHLLRHITEGICPAYNNKDKGELSQPAYAYITGTPDHKSNSYPWKYHHWPAQSSSHQPLNDELLTVGLEDFDQTSHHLEDDYEPQVSPATAIRMHQITRKAPRRGDTFMNDLRACATKLVELTNQRVDFNMRIPQIPTAPDYSLAAAVKCLNELDDIPQSSEMYLDAFEILKDVVERECFICLSPEPRRRWLQRMLQRRYPARYTYDTE